MFLPTVRPTLVIVILVFPLLNLSFGDERMTGAVGHRKKQKRGSEGLGGTRPNPHNP